MKMNYVAGNKNEQKQCIITSNQSTITRTETVKVKGIPAWICSCVPNYYCLSSSVKNILFEITEMRLLNVECFILLCISNI